MKANIEGKTISRELNKPSLIGTILSPSQNFEKIKKNPTIVSPLLLIFLFHIVGTIITAFSIDSTLLFQDGNNAVSHGTKEFVVTFTRISAIVSGICVPLIYLFLSSGVQLFLAKFTNSDVTFKQLLSLNIHIMIVTVISVWINGLFKYFIDGSIPFYITSLAGIVESDGTLFALLNGIEIFAIWHFILRAKGLQVIADFPKTFAWTVALIFFAILLAFNVMNGIALSSGK